MLRRGNCRSVATQHRRARGIDHVFDAGRDVRSPQNEEYSVVGLGRSDFYCAVRSRVQTDSFETNGLPERRLHHSQLLGRARTLQRLHTIEELWQLANHDLLANMLAMISRGVTGNRHAIRKISPNARSPCDGYAGTNSHVTVEADLPPNFDVIADYGRTG